MTVRPVQPYWLAKDDFTRDIFEVASRKKERLLFDKGNLSYLFDFKRELIYKILIINNLQNAVIA